MSLRELFKNIDVAGSDSKHQRNGWINVKCPYCHRGSEGYYLGFNINHQYFNCLAKETEVITSNGTKQIHELENKKISILTKGGNWIDTFFKSYGIQRLYKITLIRNQKEKVIFATKEHEWILKRNIHRKITTQLKKGEYLESENPKKLYIKPDIEGIQHGFVFGDGTLSGWKKKQSTACFCGHKRKWMLNYFDGLKYYEYIDRITMPKLNGLWKSLPGLNKSKEYLFGFLAGLIAADGYVRECGSVRLHNISKETLNKIRDISTKVGIPTTGISTQNRIGIGQTEPSDIHNITFFKDYITNSLILNPKYKKRLLRSKTNRPQKYQRWRVVSVVKTNRIEKVYCCNVDNTHSFVLKDNILTGNCWSCGKKPLFKTFDLLLGVKGNELKNLLKNAKKGTLKRGVVEYNKPVKRFKIPPNVKNLRFLKSHQMYLKKRGFIWQEMVSKYGIMGTTMISKLDDIDLSWRIFVPIYDNNEMVTWQTRAIGKSKVPYIACSKEREKVNIKNLLYPEEVSHTVILVEGLFDCWKVRKAGYPGVCGFGVGLSPSQIRSLANKRVIIFYDGDVAGVVESRKIQDRIEFINDKEVFIAKCPQGKDPGKLSIKRIHKILMKFV